jgi:hypothetical protein
LLDEEQTWDQILQKRVVPCQAEFDRVKIALKIARMKIMSHDIFLIATTACRARQFERSDFLFEHAVQFSWGQAFHSTGPEVFAQEQFNQEKLSGAFSQPGTG